MTNSKILAGSFIAVAALLSGLTVATAQTATQTAPAQVEAPADDAKTTRVDFRKGHGDKPRGERGGHGMVRQMMEKVDADGDRAVTQAEIDTFRTAIVTNADQSGEGDISLDEFETIYLEMTRDRMVDTFQNLDADGDGAVTKAEMDKRFGNIVERMDRNEDGKLDRNDRGGHGQKDHGREGKRHSDNRD